MAFVMTLKKCEYYKDGAILPFTWTMLKQGYIIECRAYQMTMDALQMKKLPVQVTDAKGIVKEHSKMAIIFFQVRYCCIDIDTYYHPTKLP